MLLYPYIVSSLFVGDLTAPHAAPNLVKTDNETAVNIDVLANDFDVDKDLIFLSDVDGASKLGVNLSVNNDGTIAYDPTHVFANLDAGEKVRDQFYYQVIDAFGNTDRTMVFVDIIGAKEPVITLANTGSIQILSMSKAPVLAHNFATPAPAFNPLAIPSLQPVSHGLPSSLERLLTLDDEREGRLELLLVDES